MLYPTTYGMGPFKPAIAFEETLWIKDTQYATEEEAYKDAFNIYTEACKAFTDKVKANCFAPRLHK